MGLRPERAAPTAIPAKPDSVIGVLVDLAHCQFERGCTHVDHSVLSELVQQTFGDLRHVSDYSPNQKIWTSAGGEHSLGGM